MYKICCTQKLYKANEDLGENNKINCVLEYKMHNIYGRQ